MSMLSLALDVDRVVCPRCGKHYANKGHYAWTAYGVCEFCYLQAKTDAIQEERLLVEKKREMLAMQKHLERERKAARMEPPKRKGWRFKWD